MTGRIADEWIIEKKMMIMIIKIIKYNNNIALGKEVCLRHYCTSEQSVDVTA